MAHAFADRLVVGLSTDVLNWHPGRTRSAADSFLLDNVYERLVDFDAHGDPVPALALSWTWAEPDRWVLTLRPGVRFTNGEMFDAQVAKRNLELQRDDIRAGSRTWLSDIRAIEVVDDLTLHLWTYAPEPEIPHALAWAGRMVPLGYGFDGGAYTDRAGCGLDDRAQRDRRARLRRRAPDPLGLTPPGAAASCPGS